MRRFKASAALGLPGLTGNADRIATTIGVERSPATPQAEGKGTFAMAARWLARIQWPDLRKFRPNLWMLICIQTWLHIGFAITALFGQHTAPVWRFYGGMQGFRILGVVHIVIASLIIYGVFHTWPLVRWAVLSSVTVYLVQFCLFTSGAVYLVSVGSNAAAFEGSVYGLAMVFVSSVTYRETFGLRAKPEEPAV